MPKRIVVCCDGTWDTADSGQPDIPSNVARLSRMLAHEGITAEGEMIEQLIYYQSGVATGPFTGASGWMQKMIQGATGFGLQEHLTSAYNFIATNYSPGDKIFLFGFSRGAFTVRALGWCLTQLGVLEPEDLEHFPALYKCFKLENDTIQFSEISKYPELRGWSTDGKVPAGEMSFGDMEPGAFKPMTRIKTRPKPVEIEVEGVWDTVGSLGLPNSWFTQITGFNKKWQFYNTELDDRVNHAFHALALDEHRGAFTPTLWTLTPEYKDKVDLRQCWFPGYHGDIGGGNATSAGPDRMSVDDISLAWMCDQVDGMLTFDVEASANILREVQEDVAWSAGMEKDSFNFFYGLDIAGSSVLRTPGGYSKKYHDMGHTDLKPESHYSTKEEMHPSIHLRIMDMSASYYPKALGVKPGWQYIDKAETGEGALWAKPAIGKKKGLKSRPAQNAISLKECVIRERKGMNNFQIKLLPRGVKEMLNQRNRVELELGN